MSALAFFKVVPFPLSPCLKPEILLQYLLRESGQAPWGKSHSIIGAAQWLGPLMSLTLRTIGSSGSLLRHWFPPTISSPASLLWWVSVLCIRLSVKLGGQWCALYPPLLWIQELLIFSVCSGFFHVGQDCHFQALYLQDQKPEVLFIYIYIYIFF